MKTVQVYDPPMCCSTGVCGPDVDPDLARFSALLNQLTAEGIAVERYGLGQQPMAFVQNPKVKALLETEGVAALPLLFWDGEIVSKGKYPDAAERERWLQAVGAES